MQGEHFPGVQFWMWKMTVSFLPLLTIVTTVVNCCFSDPHTMTGSNSVIGALGEVWFAHRASLPGRGVGLAKRLERDGNPDSPSGYVSPGKTARNQRRASLYAKMHSC